MHILRINLDYKGPKGINKTTIKDRQHPMMSKRGGNISMDLYNRANQMESKTKRNQEDRLKNILKMHDNNMKRGVGVAHKNKAL